MADKYSLKHFLRLAPKSLLDQYFHGRDLLTEINISALGETDIDPLYDAWLGLPEKIKAEIDEDFQFVDLVANEQGVKTILDEASQFGASLQDQFAQMDGFYDKALWTLIEHPDWLETAAMFCKADDLPKTYWHELSGIDPTSPREDKAGCEDFGDLLARYFRKKDGRGNACFVEVFKRDSRYYYFAYPEDFSKTLLEYKGKKLARTVHRPVLQLVFVYDPENRKISTYYKGNASTIRDLQQLFANEILIMTLPPPQKNTKIYNLNPLKDRNFDFKYSSSSGIVDIRLKLMRFDIIGRKAHRIVIEANPDKNPKALFDLLDEVLNTGYPKADRNHIPLTLVDVTKVGLKAYFVQNKRRKRPTKTFYLSLPDKCSLDTSGQDLSLRQMLFDSGIEPKAPPALFGL